MTDYPAHIAYIKGSEIRRLETTLGTVPKHKTEVEGLMVFHIYDKIDHPHNYIDAHRFDKATGEIVARPTRPNSAAEWDDKSLAWSWDAEALISHVRGYRKPRLQDSDWTQLADAPITEQQRKEWQVYRQALRDITKTCKAITGLDDVKWPTEPKGD